MKKISLAGSAGPGSQFPGRVSCVPSSVRVESSRVEFEPSRAGPLPGVPFYCTVLSCPVCVSVCLCVCTAYSRAQWNGEWVSFFLFFFFFLFLSADPFYDGWASWQVAIKLLQVPASERGWIGWGLGWCEGDTQTCKERPCPVQSCCSATVCNCPGALCLGGWVCSSREGAWALGDVSVSVSVGASVRGRYVELGRCCQNVGLHICGPAQACPEREGSQVKSSQSVGQVSCQSV